MLETLSTGEHQKCFLYSKYIREYTQIINHKRNAHERRLKQCPHSTAIESEYNLIFKK